MSTEHNPWSGCSSTVIDRTNIAIVAPVLDKHQYVMIREIGAETRIPQTTVHHILTEHLFKKNVAVWWVSHALIDTLKQTCLEITQEYLK